MQLIGVMLDRLYKQPMMTGQGLKRSLATQRLTKIGMHIHTCTKHYKQKTW